MEIHDEWETLEVAGDASTKKVGAFQLETVENDLYRILSQIDNTRTIFGQAAVNNCRYLADACATTRRKIDEGDDPHRTARNGLRH